MGFNVALPANTSQISLSAGYIRLNFTGTQTALSMSTLAGGYPYIPTGGPLAVYFYAAAAPSGWTLVGGVTDTLLGIQGGVSQFMAAGGTVVGTWTSGSYTLLTSDIPIRTGAGAIGALPPPVFESSVANNPHIHDWDQAPSTRPKSAVGILCTKNP